MQSSFLTREKVIEIRQTIAIRSAAKATLTKFVTWF
jgi:hypothetical protein